MNRTSVDTLFKYPVVLDGGLSNQLKSQGCDLKHSLWTSKLLITDQEEIINAHYAYLEAGAQCIITSSYQLSFAGFQTLGINKEETTSLLLKSVELAQIAIERFMKSHPNSIRPLIAASIGPYGAFLGDGSEYDGKYDINYPQLMEFHTARIDLLDVSSIDVLACETIPSFQEARVLAEILSYTQTKAWVTFSCKDEECINDGTPIVDCIELFSNHHNVFAMGVNCTHPNHISGLIKRIMACGLDKRIVVYPNMGADYDPESKTWIGEEENNFSSKRILEWLDLGADLIGGCCGVGPKEIKEISKLIDPTKRKEVQTLH
ncbi:MAG: homocysteine S-methyltransferase [Cytophagales bacterium]|nr:homocysteine S-methyltransferase [Cytophagales bacterium]